MAVQPAATKAEEAARPAGEWAFTVVSAVDGSEEPLTYSVATTTRGPGDRALGDQRRGHEVVFVTTAVSNLVRYPKDEEEEQNGKRPSRTRRRGRSRCAMCGSRRGARQSLLRALREGGGTGGGGRLKTAAAMARPYPGPLCTHSNLLRRMGDTAQQLHPGLRSALTARPSHGWERT